MTPHAPLPPDINELASEYERQLEVFRKESDQAAQFFYGYLSIHRTAAGDKSVYKFLNESPLFWKTILGSLQLSAFVTFGRIFDNRSRDNIGNFINFTQKNRVLFTRDAFRLRRFATTSRKVRDSRFDDLAWQESFLKNIYEPVSDDFRDIKSLIRDNRRIYEDQAKAIRDRYFAHRDISDDEDAKALFSETKLDDIQRLISFLGSLHEALWQLFHNGRKPIIRYREHSLERMIENLEASHHGTVQERIVEEAHTLLTACGERVGKRQTPSSPLERGSISPTSIRFDGDSMWVGLSDGRTLGVPLAWFPRLMNATPAERERAELSRVGLHWDHLDEDISVAGLLAGLGDIPRRPDEAA